jgi:uncharacterized protein with beta-barrel porin domain
VSIYSVKILLSSILGLTAAMIAAPAFAACTPPSPVSGDTVTCTGTGNPAFIAPWTGAPSLTTDLTVNIDSGASITGLAESAAGSNPQYSSVLVFDGSTVNNYGTMAPAVGQLATRDNVGVNLNGSDTTLYNYGSISVTNDGSVSSTYRLYGVISSVPDYLPTVTVPPFPETDFGDIHVVNEAGATISVTETGTAIGVARGVYSGENIDLDNGFTLDNYGTISVSRVASAAYSSSTVLAAVDSDDDTAMLTVNNHVNGLISATGANSYTVGGRAQDYEIENDGTITNTGGKAAILIWLGDDDDGVDSIANVDNSATGTINGDVIFSDELPLSPASTAYSRDSTFTNEGMINGNFYYYGLGTHSLDNSGTINGGITVNQTLYAANSDVGDGPPSFTFTNEDGATLTGDINITDVSDATNPVGTGASQNSIFLNGDGFTGNLNTTGNGDNSLTLSNVSQIASINGFNFLDLQQSNVTIQNNGTTTDFGVNLAPNSTLATTIFGPGGALAAPSTNLGSLMFASGAGTLDLTGTTTIVPTFAGIAHDGDVYELSNWVSGDTGDITVQNTSALVTLTADTTSAVPELLLESSVLSPSQVPGVSNAGIAALTNLLSYTGSNAALEALGGAVENLTSLGQVAQAAEQLRPEVNGASIQVPIEVATQFHSGIDTRLDSLFYGALTNTLASSDGPYAEYPVAKSPPPPPIPDNGVWMNAIGSNIQQHTVDNVSGYRADTGGFIAGYDYRLTDGFRVGGAVGYAMSGINDTTLIGNNTSLQNVEGIVYGTFTRPNWYINGSAGYGALNFDTVRFINFPGFSDTASGTHDGNLFAGRLDGGYAFVTPFGVWIPVASATYVHLDQDGYSENSQAGAGLTVQSQQTDSLRSGLGGKVLFPIVATPSLAAAVEAHAIWLHELENPAEVVTAGFIGGAGSFLAVGPTPSRDMADLGADLRMTLPVVGDAFSLSYNAILREQYVEQVGLFRARFDF